jgi:hypothetical protein
VFITFVVGFFSWKTLDSSASEAAQRLRERKAASRSTMHQISKTPVSKSESSVRFG